MNNVTRSSIHNERTLLSPNEPTNGASESSLLAVKAAFVSLCEDSLKMMMTLGGNGRWGQMCTRDQFSGVRSIYMSCTLRGAANCGNIFWIPPIAHIRAGCAAQLIFRIGQVSSYSNRLCCAWHRKVQACIISVFGLDNNPK